MKKLRMKYLKCNEVFMHNFLKVIFIIIFIYSVKNLNIKVESSLDNFNLEKVKECDSLTSPYFKEIIFKCVYKGLYTIIQYKSNSI